MIPQNLDEGKPKEEFTFEDIHRQACFEAMRKLVNQSKRRALDSADSLSRQSEFSVP